MNKDQHEITKSKVGFDTEGSSQVLFLPYVASIILTPSLLVWNRTVAWIWSFLCGNICRGLGGISAWQGRCQSSSFLGFKHKILNEFYNMPCFRSPVGLVTHRVMWRILNSFLWDTNPISDAKNPPCPGQLACTICCLEYRPNNRHAENFLFLVTFNLLNPFLFVIWH